MSRVFGTGKTGNWRNCSFHCFLIQGRRAGEILAYTLAILQGFASRFQYHWDNSGSIAIDTDVEPVSQIPSMVNVYLCLGTSSQVWCWSYSSSWPKALALSSSLSLGFRACYYWPIYYFY